MTTNTEALRIELENITDAAERYLRGEIAPLAHRIIAAKEALFALSAPAKQEISKSVCKDSLPTIDNSAEQEEAPAQPAEREMPPLPAPSANCHWSTTQHKTICMDYTATQMHEYGRLCAAQSRLSVADASAFWMHPVLEWNRKQVEPPIKIGREYDVACAVRAAMSSVPASLEQSPARREPNHWQQLAEERFREIKRAQAIIDELRAEREATLTQQPFAYFQRNPGWNTWEEVVASAAGEEGVVAAYRAPIAQPAIPEVWDEPQSLQIDSYMTGREGIHAHIVCGKIHLEITDGSSTWRGTIPFPKKWAGRTAAAPTPEAAQQKGGE